MTQIKVSPQDLYNQANLHSRIAQMYEDAAGQINEQAVRISNELLQWVSSRAYPGNHGSDSGNHHETYEQWRNHYTTALLAEAEKHRGLAATLQNWAQTYEQAESNLTLP